MINSNAVATAFGLIAASKNPRLQFAMSKASLQAIKSRDDVKAELARLTKVTQDIEAIFIKALISELRKTQSVGIFGKSLQSKLYDDFFDEAVATQMAKANGIGIAKRLYEHMEEPLLRRFITKTNNNTTTDKANDK